MTQIKRMGFTSPARTKVVGRTASTGRFVSTKASGKSHQSTKSDRPTFIEAAEKAEKRLKGSMKILA